MTTLLISLLSIYFFVFIGFYTKHFFREVDDKSITILSIYGLQPLLAFWGLMQRPIDSSSFEAPLLFSSIILLVLLIIVPLSFMTSFKKEERSIFIAAPIIGNTGNLGIPLGILLFGEESAFFTNAINLVNVFLVYTLGVFLYSLGNYSIVDSLKNILKMPVIWAAVFAIVLNLNGVVLNHEIEQSLKMGAYASMVLQLVLFGLFLRSVSTATFNIKLTLWLSAIKIVVIPLIAIAILGVSESSYYIKAIVFLEIIVPIAVMNSALARLYDCKPYEVVAQILLSSLLFIFVGAAYYLLLFDPALLHQSH